MNKRVLTGLIIGLIIGGGLFIVNTKNNNQQRAVPNEGDSVTFKAEDGIPVTADLYLIDNNKAPFILLFHQAGYSRGEYTEIAPKLNALGFNCIAIDQRSGSAFRGVKNETHAAAVEKKLPVGYTDAYPDMQAALKYVKKTYRPEKVIIWGSSYSSSLSLIMAAQYKEDIDAVLAFSPGEYFKYESKRIEDYAKAIEQPVFITSAKQEESQWRYIAAAIPSKQATFFIPQDSGVHGSSALLNATANSQEYWEAVTVFLKTLL